MSTCNIKYVGATSGMKSGTFDSLMVALRKRGDNEQT